MSDVCADFGDAGQNPGILQRLDAWLRRAEDRRRARRDLNTIDSRLLHDMDVNAADVAEAMRAT